jgi:competence protein ComEA
MERKRRLTIWFLSACLAATLFSAGHEEFHKGLPLAFLHYTTGGNIIRLKGCVPVPGIYHFPEHTKLATVINMTMPSMVPKIADKTLLERVIQNGDIVEAVARDRQHIEINIGKIKAKERMLLGIPLNPDRMDFADWDSLPGIGPGLAKAIMDDSHKYGAFGSIETLQRIPGIGEKKLKDLRKYF